MLSDFDFFLFSRTKLVKNEPESLSDVGESSIGKADNSNAAIEIMETSNEDDIGGSNLSDSQNGARTPDVEIRQDANGNGN